MVLNENSPIIFSKNLLQFVSLLPEVTTLHNQESEVISTLSYIGFACSLDKRANFAWETLEFITVSLPLPLNQSHFIFFSPNRLQKWHLCFLLLSIIHIPLLTKTQTVQALGVSAQTLPTAHQSWAWITIIYHQMGTSHPEGEPGHRKKAVVMGTHMDTNSHACRP